MPYRLKAGLFVENGPAIHAERARYARSGRTVRAWKALDADRRLALVESELGKAANENLPDGLPVAL